jgi:hypothetical protein
VRGSKAARLRNCGHSDGGAGALDGIADRVGTFASPSPPTPQAAPIRATLANKRCSAAGISASGYAPVLELCRALVAAAHHPDQTLHVFRGTTLAIVVGSIGKGAKLTVEDDARGRPRFRLWRDRRGGTASLTSQSQQSGHEQCASRDSALGTRATINGVESSEILVPTAGALSTRIYRDG